MDSIGPKPSGTYASDGEFSSSSRRPSAPPPPSEKGHNWLWWFLALLVLAGLLGYVFLHPYGLRSAKQGPSPTVTRNLSAIEVQLKILEEEEKQTKLLEILVDRAP